MIQTIRMASENKNIFKVRQTLVKDEFSRGFTVSPVGGNQTYTVYISTSPSCTCSYGYHSNDHCIHIQYVLNDILGVKKKYSTSPPIPVSELFQIFNGNKPLTYLDWLDKVKTNGLLLHYVQEQTPEICMAAIKNNESAFKYVKNQTNELCIKALKLNPYIIMHIRDQTTELCEMAIDMSPGVLKYINNQTQELCMRAIKLDPAVLEDVREQTHELCMFGIRENANALQFVRNKTIELCREAIKLHENSIHYIDTKQFPLRDLVEIVVFEDIIHNKFVKLDKETDLLTTIYRYIELVFGSGIKTNAEKLYNDKVPIDKIMKDDKILGIYIVKINDNLYEVYNKTPKKINVGWVRNNYYETTETNKIGRMFIPV